MPDSLITECNYFEILAQVKSGSIKLLDLRAPTEFAQGAMPFALNLPLFSDEERAEVGTIYRKEGPRDAIQLGIEIFASKAGQFIDEAFSLVNSERELAIHCARGGMRSKSIALYLATMGVRVKLITGGYKKFRNQIANKLENLARHPLLVLIGMTGSGKTDIIQKLSAFATIDFEGIARHRGSALGAIQQDRSPANQQEFENWIAVRYEEIKHHKLILVEHENNLGPVILPQFLRKALNEAPMVHVERAFNDRVRHLVEIYASNWNEKESAKFVEGMNLFKDRISSNDKAEIMRLAQQQDFVAVAESLLRLRYDRVYEKSLARYEKNIIKKLDFSSNQEQSLQWLKDKLTDP